MFASSIAENPTARHRSTCPVLQGDKGLLGGLSPVTGGGAPASRTLQQQNTLRSLMAGNFVRENLGRLMFVISASSVHALIIDNTSPANKLYTHIFLACLPFLLLLDPLIFKSRVESPHVVALHPDIDSNLAVGLDGLNVSQVLNEKS